MLYWKHVTRQANQAQSGGQLLDALLLNQEALDVALATFNEQFLIDAESAVSMVVVSFLNVAESNAELCRLVEANRTFERALDFLQGVMVQPEINADHQAIIRWTAEHVRFEWDLFQQSAGAKLYALARRECQFQTANSVSFVSVPLSHAV